MINRVETTPAMTGINTYKPDGIIRQSSNNNDSSGETNLSDFADLNTSKESDAIGGIKPGIILTPAKSDGKTPEEIIDGMTVEDAAISDTQHKNLIKNMSLYPKEILQFISDTGFRIHIVEDPPQPAGSIKPSDLGFGDHNGDGVVNFNDYVDFNGNGIADPWEYEGKVGIADASGKMHTLSLDEYVDGAYMPSKNIIYLFKSLLDDERSNSGEYTIIHEFAHAVDFNLRKDPVIGEKFHNMVNNLYNACKYKMPEHNFFDGYQATNRAEFFGVSMQSYMSPKQLKDETGKFMIGNCYRDNLKKNDMHTFKFMESFLQNPLQPDNWYDFTR